MRTEHLRYFLEVAKCHSIGLAAEKLFVTQPTVTIALKNLEQELETTLFFRSKNGMFLTKTGQVVLEKANEILAKEQELYSLTCLPKIETQYLSGSLTIATIPIVSYVFFAKTLTHFIQKNPHVKLDLLERSSKKALQLLLEDECDITFFLANSNELRKYHLEDTFVLQHLLTEKIYIVAHTSFGLAQHKSLTLADIKHLPLAISYFDVEENMTEQYTVLPTNSNLVLSTCNFDLILKLITNGTVVSSLLNSMLPQLPPNAEVDIIPVINPSKMDIYCAYKKDAAKNNLIQAFISELLTHI